MAHFMDGAERHMKLVRSDAEAAFVLRRLIQHVERQARTLGVAAMHAGQEQALDFMSNIAPTMSAVNALSWLFIDAPEQDAHMDTWLATLDREDALTRETFEASPPHARQAMTRLFKRYDQASLEELLSMIAQRAYPSG